MIVREDKSANPVSLLQVCLAYAPNHNGGGAAYSAAALTAVLLKAGHKVAVLAPKLSGARFRRPRMFGERHTLPNEAEVRFVGTWLQFGFNAINPGALFALPAMLRSADLVIIHGLRTFCGALAALMCVMTRKPFILFPHGMAVPRWRSLGKKFVYDRICGHRILQHAQALFCLSSIERQEVMRLTGRPSDEVPVIDATQLEPAPPALHQPARCDVAQILMLGRLVPEKGVELVIDAIAQRNLRSTYKLCVVGPEEDKQYAAALRHRAEALSVQICFTGGVYGEGRNQILMESHILALVSKYESYGRVAMEALRMGTPVLVTDTCGIASDLDRTRGVVVQRSVESIGEALASLGAQDFHQLRTLRQVSFAAASQRTGDGSSSVVELILRSARHATAPAVAMAQASNTFVKRM